MWIIKQQTNGGAGAGKKLRLQLQRNSPAPDLWRWWRWPQPRQLWGLYVVRGCPPWGPFILGNKKKSVVIKSSEQDKCLGHWRMSAANQSPTKATKWEWILRTHLEYFFYSRKSSCRISWMVSNDTLGLTTSFTSIFLNFRRRYRRWEGWEWDHFSFSHGFCLSGL